MQAKSKSLFFEIILLFFPSNEEKTLHCPINVTLLEDQLLTCSYLQSRQKNLAKVETQVNLGKIREL